MLRFFFKEILQRYNTGYLLILLSQAEVAAVRTKALAKS